MAYGEICFDCAQHDIAILNSENGFQATTANEIASPYSYRDRNDNSNIKT